MATIHHGPKSGWPKLEAEEHPVGKDVEGYLARWGEDSRARRGEGLTEKR
jgi:hypothetical protein